MGAERSQKSDKIYSFPELWPGTESEPQPTEIQQGLGRNWDGEQVQDLRCPAAQAFHFLEGGSQLQFGAMGEQKLRVSCFSWMAEGLESTIISSRNLAGLEAWKRHVLRAWCGDRYKRVLCHWRERQQPGLWIFIPDEEDHMHDALLIQPANFENSPELALFPHDSYQSPVVLNLSKVGVISFMRWVFHRVLSGDYCKSFISLLQNVKCLP